MNEIERAQKITKEVYKEYKKKYLESIKTNKKLDFKELEELLFLERKYYSILSNFELEKLKLELTRDANVPEGIHFFDFFYCFDSDARFLNYRIRSSVNLERAKREFGTNFPGVQIGYFPLCIEETEDYMMGIYNDYRIMHSLLLHNFLGLIEENKYLSKMDKEKVKFLSSYMYPVYENYFLKNVKRKTSHFSDIYQNVKDFMTYGSADIDDEELADFEDYLGESLGDNLFHFFSDYYDSYVLRENHLFLEEAYLPSSKSFTRFIYLSCYVKSFFKLCEDVPVLEENPFFRLRKCEIEDHYQEEVEKYYQKQLKR